MPSTSKAQQQLMGMAYALKKGDMDPKDASQEVKDLADSMTLQQLKDFASTKHEGLPDHVKEGEDHEVGMAMSQLNAISKAVGELLQKIGREEKDLPGWLQDHISQSYNYIKQANDGYYEMDEMVSPDSIGGMGATALPSPTSVGSGDVPKGAGDAKEEEEEEKKRRKEFLKKFKSFEEFIGESNSDSVPLVLTADQDFEEVKRFLSTDKKAKDLNFTHWESGRYLGANRGHLITMFFSNTKDEVKDFIERNNINVANKFAFLIDESFVNEGKEPIEVFAKEEEMDGFQAKIYTAKFDGTSIEAQSTDKTWPDGTPVTKFLTRGGFKRYTLKGEFPVIDSSRGWWYYKVGRNWFATKKSEYETPPFEY